MGLLESQTCNPWQRQQHLAVRRRPCGNRQSRLLAVDECPRCQHSEDCEPGNPANDAIHRITACTRERCRSCTTVTRLVRALCCNRRVEQGAHSFGEERRICEVEGFRVAETCIRAGLILAPHSHPSAQIAYVLEGEYREQLGGRDLLLNPGTIMAHEPGEIHANEFSACSDVLVLLVSVDARRWIRFDGERPVRARALLDDLANEMRAEMRRGDAAARVALEGLGMLALSRLARSAATGSGEPEWLQDAAALIERRYSDPLSLTSVADAVGVHRTTLAIAFRRFRRTSVGEHIRSVRVNRARHALVTTGSPLSEIALVTGFHDQSHFTRVFRSLTGMTPGEYRRRHIWSAAHGRRSDLRLLCT